MMATWYKTAGGGASSEPPSAGALLRELSTETDMNAVPAVQEGQDARFVVRDAVRTWLCERSGELGGRRYVAGHEYQEAVPGWHRRTVPAPGHEAHDICRYCACCCDCGGGRIGWDCPACGGN
jgi:hypothetical protein